MVTAFTELTKKKYMKEPRENNQQKWNVWTPKEAVTQETNEWSTWQGVVCLSANSGVSHGVGINPMAVALKTMVDKSTGYRLLLKHFQHVEVPMHSRDEISFM